ncbi:unnamed protein product [Gordionus sp. m RMFG-2023]
MMELSHELDLYQVNAIKEWKTIEIVSTYKSYEDSIIIKLWQLFTTWRLLKRNIIKYHLYDCLNNTCNWKILHDVNSRVLLILQDSKIEIRSGKDSFANVDINIDISHTLSEVSKAGWNIKRYFRALAISDSHSSDQSLEEENVGKHQIFSFATSLVEYVHLFSLADGKYLISFNPNSERTQLDDSEKLDQHSNLISYMVFVEPLVVGNNSFSKINQNDELFELWIISFQGTLLSFIINLTNQSYFMNFEFDFVRPVYSAQYDSIHQLLITAGPIKTKESCSSQSLNPKSSGFLQGWRRIDSITGLKALDFSLFSTFLPYTFDEETLGNVLLRISPNQDKLAILVVTKCDSKTQNNSRSLLIVSGLPGFGILSKVVLSDGKIVPEKQEITFVCGMEWYSGPKGQIAFLWNDGIMCIENVIPEKENKEFTIVNQKRGDIRFVARGLNNAIKFSKHDNKSCLVRVNDGKLMLLEYKYETNKSRSNANHNGAHVVPMYGGENVIVKYITDYLNQNIYLNKYLDLCAIKLGLKPTTESLLSRHKLYLVESTTPQDLFERKIDKKEFAEALALANEYGLDKDRVYQSQWLSSRKAKQDVDKYLDKISDKSWVIDQTLICLPFTLQDTEDLLLYGLGKLKILKLDRDEGKRTKLINIQIDHLNARFFRYLFRLQIYKKILETTQKLTNYNSAYWGYFRTANIFEAMVNICQTSDSILAAQTLTVILSSLSTYKCGHIIEPHWLLIISNLSESLPVETFVKLLPSGHVDTEGQIILTMNIDNHNYFGSPFTPDFFLPCIELEIEDDASILYSNLNDQDLNLFKSYPITPATLSKFVKHRAIGIEKISRLPDIALKLVDFGIKNNLAGLQSIRHRLRILNILVYDCQLNSNSTISNHNYSSDLTLEDLNRMEPSQIIQIAMSEGATSKLDLFPDTNKKLIPAGYDKGGRQDIQKNYAPLSAESEKSVNFRLKIRKYLLPLLDEYYEFSLYLVISTSDTSNRGEIINNDTANKDGDDYGYAKKNEGMFKDPYVLKLNLLNDYVKHLVSSKDFDAIHLLVNDLLKPSDNLTRDAKIRLSSNDGSSLLDVKIFSSPDISTIEPLKPSGQVARHVSYFFEDFCRNLLLNCMIPYADYKYAIICGDILDILERYLLKFDIYHRPKLSASDPKAIKNIIGVGLESTKPKYYPDKTTRHKLLDIIKWIRNQFRAMKIMNKYDISLDVSQLQNINQKCISMDVTSRCIPFIDELVHKMAQKSLRFPLSRTFEHWELMYHDLMQINSLTLTPSKNGNGIPLPVRSLLKFMLSSDDTFSDEFSNLDNPNSPTDLDIQVSTYHESAVTLENQHFLVPLARDIYCLNLEEEKENYSNLQEMQNLRISKLNDIRTILSEVVSEYINSAVDCTDRQIELAKFCLRKFKDILANPDGALLARLEIEKELKFLRALDIIKHDIKADYCVPLQLRLAAQKDINDMMGKYIIPAYFSRNYPSVNADKFFRTLEKLVDLLEPLGPQHPRGKTSLKFKLYQTLAEYSLVKLEDINLASTYCLKIRSLYYRSLDNDTVIKPETDTFNKKKIEAREEYSDVDFWLVCYQTGFKLKESGEEDLDLIAFALSICPAIEISTILGARKTLDIYKDSGLDDLDDQKSNSKIVERVSQKVSHVFAYISELSPRQSVKPSIADFSDANNKCSTDFDLYRNAYFLFIDDSADENNFNDLVGVLRQISGLISLTFSTLQDKHDDSLFSGDHSKTKDDLTNVTREERLKFRRDYEICLGKFLEVLFLIIWNLSTSYLNSDGETVSLILPLCHVALCLSLQNNKSIDIESILAKFTTLDDLSPLRKLCLLIAIHSYAVNNSTSQNNLIFSSSSHHILAYVSKAIALSLERDKASAAYASSKDKTLNYSSPPGEKLLDCLNRLSQYHDLSLLTSFNKGINLDYFVNDRAYMLDTLNGLALSSDELLFDRTLDLARKLKAPLVDIYINHLEHLLSCDDVDVNHKTHVVYEKLLPVILQNLEYNKNLVPEKDDLLLNSEIGANHNNPLSLANNLWKNVLPLMDRSDLGGLALFFDSVKKILIFADGNDQSLVPKRLLDRLDRHIRALKNCQELEQLVNNGNKGVYKLDYSAVCDLEKEEPSTLETLLYNEPSQEPSINTICNESIHSPPRISESPVRDAKLFTTLKGLTRFYILNRTATELSSKVKEDPRTFLSKCVSFASSDFENLQGSRQNVPGLVYSTWCIESFWAAVQKKYMSPNNNRSLLNEKDSLKCLKPCFSYLPLLMPRRNLMLTFVDDCFFGSDRKLAGREDMICRDFLSLSGRLACCKTILDFVTSLGSDSDAIEPDQNLLIEEISKRIQHLESLDDNVLIYLKSNTDPRIRDYELSYDLTAGDEKRMKQILIKMLMNKMNDSFIFAALANFIKNRIESSTSSKFDSSAFISQIVLSALSEISSSIEDDIFNLSPLYNGIPWNLAFFNVLAYLKDNENDSLPDIYFPCLEVKFFGNIKLDINEYRIKSLEIFNQVFNRNHTDTLLEPDPRKASKVFSLDPDNTYSLYAYYRTLSTLIKISQAFPKSSTKNTFELVVTKDDPYRFDVNYPTESVVKNESYNDSVDSEKEKLNDTPGEKHNSTKHILKIVVTPFILLNFDFALTLAKKLISIFDKKFTSAQQYFESIYSIGQLFEAWPVMRQKEDQAVLDLWIKICKICCDNIFCPPPSPSSLRERKLKLITLVQGLENVLGDDYPLTSLLIAYCVTLSESKNDYQMTSKIIEEFNDGENEDDSRFYYRDLRDKKFEYLRLAMWLGLTSDSPECQSLALELMEKYYEKQMSDNGDTSAVDLSSHKIIDRKPLKEKSGGSHCLLDEFLIQILLEKNLLIAAIRLCSQADFQVIRKHFIDTLDNCDDKEAILASSNIKSTIHQLKVIGLEERAMSLKNLITAPYEKAYTISERSNKENAFHIGHLAKSTATSASQSLLSLVGKRSSLFFGNGKFVL